MSGSGFSWCLWGVLEIRLWTKIEAMEKPVSDQFKFMLKKIVLEKNDKGSFVILIQASQELPPSRQAASS